MSTLSRKAEMSQMAFRVPVKLLFPTFPPLQACKLRRAPVPSGCAQFCPSKIWVGIDLCPSPPGGGGPSPAGSEKKRISHIAQDRMGHQWADFQILWTLVGGGARHPGQKTGHNAVELRLRQWIIDRQDKRIVVMQKMVISQGGTNSAQICTQTCKTACSEAGCCQLVYPWLIASCASHQEHLCMSACIPRAFDKQQQASERP